MQCAGRVKLHTLSAELFEAFLVQGCVISGWRKGAGLGRGFAKTPPISR